MAFFGLFTFFAVVAALILTIPVLVEYIRHGWVPRFPTLIVAVGLGVMAMLSFAVGCILDTIKKYNDRMMMMTTEVLLRQRKKEPGND